MKNKPYKIDNGSSGFMSALGSGAVAVGSVATAIVLVVPGMPGYELIADGIDSAGVGLPLLSNPSANGQTSTYGVASDQATSTSAGSVGTASDNSALPTSPKNEVSGPTGTPNSPLAAVPAPTGPGSGNTSSPTPGGSSWSGGGSTPGGGSGNTTSPTPSSGANPSNGSSPGNGAGNTTSPTPGGGEEEEEEEDD